MSAEHETVPRSAGTRPVRGVSPSGGGPGGESLARIFLRPVASPLPLGVFAFAVGTLLLSLLEIGALPMREAPSVGLFIAAAIFPTELAAALIAVYTRDTPSLTALGLLSGSWAAFGAYFITAGPGGTPSATVGVFALGIGGSLVVFALVAAMGKRFLGALLGIAAGRYIVFGLYQITGETSLNTAAGIVGLALVGICAYGGLGLLLEDATHRTILPLFRTGEARSSIEGGIREQLEPLQQEPGVRSQL